MNYCSKKSSCYFLTSKLLNEANPISLASVGNRSISSDKNTNFDFSKVLVLNKITR